jgi:hypothetical protein
MKALRLVSFVIFATCAFCLTAEAQKKFTYKGDNGATGARREEFTIVITERPYGYEVSGHYANEGAGIYCLLRGSYLPAGTRLRATCPSDTAYGTLEVTGFKPTGKDAFQVHVETNEGKLYPFGGEIVAWRNGVKPKTPSSEQNPLVGTWEGTSGVGGFAEVWTIENNNSQWSVTGTWARDGKKVGSFSGKDYEYKDGKLSFTQIINEDPIKDKDPKKNWKSGTKLVVWADGGNMEFTWITPSGQGGTVSERKKKN